MKNNRVCSFLIKNMERRMGIFLPKECFGFRTFTDSRVKRARGGRAIGVLTDEEKFLFTVCSHLWEKCKRVETKDISNGSQKEIEEIKNVVSRLHILTHAVLTLMMGLISARNDCVDPNRIKICQGWQVVISKQEEDPQTLSVDEDLLAGGYAKLVRYPQGAIPISPL